MQSAPRRPVGRREVIAEHKQFIKETIRNFWAETSLETAMAQTVLGSMIILLKHSSNHEGLGPIVVYFKYHSGLTSETPQ